jgi:hypothetical protein
MTQNRLRPLSRLVVALAPLLLGSCSSGSDREDFSAFVKDLFATETKETNDPTPINGKSFTFSSDPAEFDDLFQ